MWITLGYMGKYDSNARQSFKGLFGKGWFNLIVEWKLANPCDFVEKVLQANLQVGVK